MSVVPYSNKHKSQIGDFETLPPGSKQDGDVFRFSNLYFIETRTTMNLKRPSSAISSLLFFSCVLTTDGNKVINIYIGRSALLPPNFRAGHMPLGLDGDVADLEGDAGPEDLDDLAVVAGHDQGHPLHAGHGAKGGGPAGGGAAADGGGLVVVHGPLLVDIA